MIEQMVRYSLPAALALLPPVMTSDEARAEVIAAGLQESEFQRRRQIGGGPARSFFQFEKVGVRGVVTHRQSRAHLASALGQLRYGAAVGQTAVLHAIIEHNDVLACVFARLLLWTLPDPLPARDDPDAGWKQYLAAWRPGKPRPLTWDAHFANAWALVDAANEEPRQQAERIDLAIATAIGDGASLEAVDAIEAARRAVRLVLPV